MIRRTTALFMIGTIITLATTAGCAATGPITLGLSAAWDAFSSLFDFSAFTRSHAEDTFLNEKTVILEATLDTLEVMTLDIEETKEKGNATIIIGASQASKSTMEFSVNVREVSPTVTNVAIRAERGFLKPDHSTAEEIMNQLVLRLENSTAASRVPAPLAPPAVSALAASPMWRETERPSPYVVQVGSYRTKAHADRHVDELRELQSQAYAVPFTLADRGQWHRVLIQRFATQEEARRFAGKIMADGLVDLAFPVFLPFAVQVGTKKHANDASLVETRLRNEGFSPYVHHAPNNGPNRKEYRILVGAYETSSAAATLSQTLLSAKIPNQVVTP